MATANVTTFASVIEADTTAPTNKQTLVMRDNSGDCALARRGSVVRLTVSAGEYLTGQTTKTASYTATSEDRIIICDTSSGSVTITLPAAVSSTGQVLTVFKTSASNNLVLDANASETIFFSGAVAATTKTSATNGATATIWCDGTGWYGTSVTGTWT